MPYASGRTYYDADSHLMELGDWLAPYADPGRAREAAPAVSRRRGQARRGGGDAAAARRGDADAARALEANLMGAKGWGALGAFDRDERTRALDLLGFEQPARVQHLRADAVRRRRPRAALRRRARAQPRDRRTSARRTSA